MPLNPVAGAGATVVGFTVAAGFAVALAVALALAVAVAEGVTLVADFVAVGSAVGTLISPTAPLSAGGVMERTAPRPVTVPAAIKIAFLISTLSRFYLRVFWVPAELQLRLLSCICHSVMKLKLFMMDAIV